ncbi:alpha-glucuronidase family glycosyl hydrolase [Chitinophaga sp. Cy-1792]|uniref:alpha-glucuronidase family glycosyl hydrolase n=1 Tax=Chitinophaga sp. Cy-1792 TaxID=2608339 RepID=UPI0014200EC1|nr:alpha-glucuronidase family glycosyl hydrolase [Chitinophaga sp. Cy-1792]NIG55991.1 alpha-glucuronidase [Chitinophaga sp. Cy-1792]
MKKVLLILFIFLCGYQVQAEDGYNAWLRYTPISQPALLSAYRTQIASCYIPGHSPTDTAIRNELQQALHSMLQQSVSFTAAIQPRALVCARINLLPAALQQQLGNLLTNTDSSGYLLKTISYAGKNLTVITAKTDIGVLYGTFALLRKMQEQQPISNLDEHSSPKLKLRLLNHWDNLTRYVERGYAGISIWNWHTLPTYIDPRYTDYARLNASIGINGTVLNNVNASATILTRPWLLKVAAIAKVLRPYGIRVYLSARFSAPIEIGNLHTADPLNDSVRTWWQEKAKEIYSIIPDFGGFLVKANSEGQPGPQSYGRSHADGANLLADALAPYGGIVMWRAFVYNPEATDRFKQAYEEFTPLDGKFHSNVLVQVKNGPIDFQPREPISPLLAAMPKTPLLLEFQLTQEYLGQGTHLVYEAPLFKEVLETDTYANGKNSTVASIVDGDLNQHTLTGITGVANIGNERNWTNHPFGQANWYALGRLAWNPQLSSDTIAKEWIRQTFGCNPKVINTIDTMMLASRETMVQYMTPLGLHHIMGNGHHYGPAPWSNHAPRPDWDPVYYHKADNFGIGFDRTATGSNALAQYQPGLRQQYADSSSCDPRFLLWFHHVSWQHKMPSGRTLWNELCYQYNAGVNGVTQMQQQWKNIAPFIDPERYQQVTMLLGIQHQDAIWWRDACLSYFSSIAKLPIPAPYPMPAHPLEYYQQLRFPYAPGN